MKNRFFFLLLTAAICMAGCSSSREGQSGTDTVTNGTGTGMDTGTIDTTNMGNGTTDTNSTDTVGIGTGTMDTTGSGTTVTPQ